jgi:hypothetical protein
MFKKIIVTILITAASNCYADAFSYTGKIKRIRSHDQQVFNYVVDWVAIEGFTYAGSCRTAGGDVVLRLRDDNRANRQLAMFIAANLSNKSVRVQVDDSVKDGAGYCFLRYMDLL